MNLSEEFVVNYESFCKTCRITPNSKLITSMKHAASLASSNQCINI